MWGPLVLAGDLGCRRRTAAGEDVEFRAPNPCRLLAAGQRVERWLEPVPRDPAPSARQAWGATATSSSSPSTGCTAASTAPIGISSRPAVGRASGRGPRRGGEAAPARGRDGWLRAARTDAGRTRREPAGRPVDAGPAARRYGRRASDWFSFDLPVDPARPMALVVTYQPRRARKRAASTSWWMASRSASRRSRAAAPSSRTGSSTSSTRFPPTLVKGKQKVTVRFQATGGNEVAAVYGVRVIRITRWRTRR